MGGHVPITADNDGSHHFPPLAFLPIQGTLLLSTGNYSTIFRYGRTTDSLPTFRGRRCSRRDQDFKLGWCGGLRSDLSSARPGKKVYRIFSIPTTHLTELPSGELCMGRQSQLYSQNARRPPLNGTTDLCYKRCFPRRSKTFIRSNFHSFRLTKGRWDLWYRKLRDHVPCPCRSSKTTDQGVCRRFQRFLPVTFHLF